MRAGTERHFLVPAKSNTRWMIVEGIEQDASVELKVPPAARKKDEQLSANYEYAQCASKVRKASLCIC